MSAITEQLLERIGAELGEIRRKLDRLRAEFGEHPTIHQATELYDQLNGRLADARAKAARNELRDDDVVALSETIGAGLKKMVSLVASGEGDSDTKAGPMH